MNMGSVKTDLYQGHDYYMMDDLLTEEHKLIRDAARAWVKQEVSPIIEEAAETQVFPKHLLPGLGAIGAFGPLHPRAIRRSGAGPDFLRTRSCRSWSAATAACGAQHPCRARW